MDNPKRERKLVSIDLNETKRERIADSRVQFHPNVDAVLEAMARDGWQVTHMAAGFGNWIYVLVERL